MEVLALVAICLLTAIGWVAVKLCFAKIISDENCIYFSPAIGAAICGIVGYGAVRIHKPWLIWVVCVVIAFCAFRYRTRLRSPGLLRPEPWAFVRFAVHTPLCLYGMQTALYGLFSRTYPGQDEVWSLFIMTGPSPTNNMFALHHARFAAK